MYDLEFSISNNCVIAIGQNYISYYWDSQDYLEEKLNLQEEIIPVKDRTFENYYKDKILSSIVEEGYGYITPCWVWQKARIRNYGSIQIYHKPWRVHRYMYINEYGKIPDAIKVCHKCDNPPCCRPDHLFAGTNKDNTQDGLKKNRPIGKKFNPAKGHDISHSKLIETDVLEIRESTMNKRYLAEKYNVSFQTISDILLRKTWGHV